MSARKHKLSKKGKARLAGYTILGLAVLGVAFLVFLGTKGVQFLLDDSDKRLEYQKFIEPVVMLDPVPFDSPDQANPDFLLQSAVWAVLKNEDTSRYATDQTGAVLLPAADVDLYGAKLYGSDIKLEHKSFGDDTMKFQYDTATQCYRLPATGLMGYYTPLVSKMEKRGKIIRLTVGYVAAGSAWTGDADGNIYQPEVDKTMIYTLAKTSDGSYVIHSIAEAAEDETVKNEQKKGSSSASSSAPAAGDGTTPVPGTENSPQEDTTSGEAAAPAAA